MDFNEIKKTLYKQKPTAKLEFRDRCINCKWYYEAKLLDGTKVNFEVPVSEMGEKKFEEELPAQFLIRWLV